VAAQRQTRRRTPAAAPRSRRRLPVRPGLVLWILTLALVAFLYARPISSYLDTRAQLEARQAEVVGLRAEKARVTARLARSTSVDALAREARLIGRVRPGEQLFIVKGVDAWGRRHAAGR
jgi:cell division protein FtsB